MAKGKNPNPLLLQYMRLRSPRPWNVVPPVFARLSRLALHLPFLTPPRRAAAVCRRSCKTVADVAAKLRLKRTALQATFGPAFRPFFAWLFEMGRQITALNTGADVSVVRSVPLDAGLQLIGARAPPPPCAPP